MYGTMGAGKDEVKDLQQSTKKTCTKKSKSYAEMYYMYTNIPTKYGVLNFKTDEILLKGGRRPLARMKALRRTQGCREKTAPPKLRKIKYTDLERLCLNI